MTYGNRKSVDLYAISDYNNRALKIEVKTSQQGNFVTCISQKHLEDDPCAPDFWVLFQIRPEGTGKFTERFFILTHKEICGVQKGRNKVYEDKYMVRHGCKPDLSKGVDNVTAADVEQFEDLWSKIVGHYRTLKGSAR
ncbi:MAG: hypothetical protein WBE86_12280 [Candidatus Acidiferrales bacterium]